MERDVAGRLDKMLSCGREKILKALGLTDSEMAAANAANTVEEAEAAYSSASDKTPEGKKAREVSLEKWIRFSREKIDAAQTTKEIGQFFHTIHVSTEETAIQKAAVLLKSEDEAATVAAELQAEKEDREAAAKLADDRLKRKK